MQPFEAALKADRRLIETHLRKLLKQEKGVPARLRAAMGHSLLGGGKRLRPLLVLWAWDAVAVRGRKRPVARADALTAACALEMLHTYSLIHDDLPAMDDDVLRRGQPTCHVVFGEATAILAGDALQALAFAQLARCAGGLAGPLIQEVADAIGPAGMVGGQQEDLDSEGTAVDARQVRRIHLGKTARLLSASLAVGARLGGADEPTRAAFAAAGVDLGLAFQGADDVLDQTASTAVLGKTVGKDAEAEKATWVRVEGLEKARSRALRHGRKGVRTLEAALDDGPAVGRLLALAELMFVRDR